MGRVRGESAGSEALGRGEFGESWAGVGATELCGGIAEEARLRGCWKPIGKVFPENTACVRMLGRCGFEAVGLHRRHGRLDGGWRDVLLVERLLGDAREEAAFEEGPSGVQDAGRRSA